MTGTLFGALVPPSSAVCQYPGLEVAPTSVGAGGTIAVAGQGFGTACNDTGRPPQGACGRTGGDPREAGIRHPSCGSTPLEPETSRSYWRQGIAADGDYRFLVTIAVPVTLRTR